MGLNVAQKLIKSHLLSGAMTAGKEIGIRIDQTLTQDATGTLVMLELCGRYCRTHTVDFRNARSGSQKSATRWIIL